MSKFTIAGKAVLQHLRETREEEATSIKGLTRMQSLIAHAVLISCSRASRLMRRCYRWLSTKMKLSRRWSKFQRKKCPQLKWRPSFRRYRTTDSKRSRALYSRATSPQILIQLQALLQEVTCIRVSLHAHQRSCVYVCVTDSANCPTDLCGCSRLIPKLPGCWNIGDSR